MVKKNKVNTQNTQTFFTEISFRCKAVSLLPITTVSDCYHISFVLYSVQSQVPSTGESSYSINVSGGNATVGDYSVINVGTATPR